MGKFFSKSMLTSAGMTLLILAVINNVDALSGVADAISGKKGFFS